MFDTAPLSLPLQRTQLACNALGLQHASKLNAPLTNILSRLCELRTSVVEYPVSLPAYCTQGQLSVMVMICVGALPSLVFQHRTYASCSAMSGLPGNLFSAVELG